jgi:hypothetical protein
MISSDDSHEPKVILDCCFTHESISTCFRLQLRNGKFKFKLKLPLNTTRWHWNPKSREFSVEQFSEQFISRRVLKIGKYRENLELTSVTIAQPDSLHPHLQPDRIIGRFAADSQCF